MNVDRMFTYVLGGLEMAHQGLRELKYVAKRQSKTIRGLSAFAIAATAYAIVNEWRLVRQEDQIERLTKTVKELKETEGE